MRKLILVLLIFMACSTPVKKQSDQTDDFFSMCRKDIAAASKVIVDNDIVKNLSHLLKMNYGGKKYYLLEREAITKMIQSVTEGVYSDFILINKQGTVIYTKKNEEIFGKNVRSAGEDNPLFLAYTNRQEPFYFQDITFLNNEEGSIAFFVSQKVAGGNSFPGIFILQIDHRTIGKIFGTNSEILDSHGIIRYSPDFRRLIKKHELAEEITDSFNMEEVLKKHGIRFEHVSDNGINWYIIKK